MLELDKFNQSVLAGLVTPVILAIQEFGGDTDAILERAGITAKSLENPRSRIGFERFNELMRAGCAATGMETLGIRAAAFIQPQMLSALGLGWLASDTVHDGLRRLVRFRQVISTTSQMELREEGDLLYLDIGRDIEVSDLCYSTRDYAAGMIIRMSQLTMGMYLSPVHVELERPEPQVPADWESFWSTKVQFSCDASAIAWSLLDVSERLLSGDPELARVNDDEVELYLGSFIEERVSRDVLQSIMRRLPDGTPSQSQIASDLCIGNRTLQRRLKEEGHSFSGLMHDARLQLAKRYLKVKNLSVGETAYLLGFSDPSSFSRAFKKMTGLTASEFQSGSYSTASR
ncbi:MAG: AraC family transcriptional regulator [Halieaceae bacterium]